MAHSWPKRRSDDWLNHAEAGCRAERWLAEHPQVGGNVISLQEAAAAGRAVFGDVLTQS